MHEYALGHLRQVVPCGAATDIIFRVADKRSRCRVAPSAHSVHSRPMEDSLCAGFSPPRLGLALHIGSTGSAVADPGPVFASRTLRECPLPTVAFTLCKAFSGLGHGPGCSFGPPAFWHHRHTMRWMPTCQSHLWGWPSIFSWAAFSASSHVPSSTHSWHVRRGHIHPHTRERDGSHGRTKDRRAQHKY